MKRFQVKGMSIMKEVGLSVLSLIVFIAEYIFRFIYLCLPLWFFLLMVSLRDKCNAITALDIYANDKAVFQHIYPGVLIVLLDHKALVKNIQKSMTQMETFLYMHRYTIISLLLFLIIVAICIF